MYTKQYSSTFASTEGYDFSKQVGYLLRRVYQRHTALFQKAIPETQLTVGQFVVMCAVRDDNACSLSQIAKRTAIDPATVRGIMERLKARGLLKIDPNVADRRKVRIRLTEDGDALIASMVPIAVDISERTFNGLNPAERMALVYLLDKMGKRQ